MDGIILAAGYATRLWPLTKNYPKPLLEVAGKPMIEHIVDKLEEISLNKIYVVTNNKFYNNFIGWSNKIKSKIPIEIINDGTLSNDDRLGAVGDVNFAINKKKITNDIIVIAGDNLFEFSLKGSYNLFRNVKSTTIALHDVKDLKLATLYGVVAIDNNKKIIDFQEKPKKPKSTLISTGVYFFPKKQISLIKEYVEKNVDADKTGSFIQWLYNKVEVYAYVTHKAWHDIGDKEQLKEVRKTYKGKK